ncbi:MAG: hypothetical protein ABIS20_18105 [Thermoanaerobaculia bacterium]
MVTVPVRIILQGLIALVPQNSPDGATMTALVVDAMNTQNVECYAHHKPELRFPTADCNSAPDCGYEVGNICLCSLQNREVSLLPQQVGRSPVSLDGHPDRPVPFDRSTAGNFSYVANLSNLGYNLDRVFLSHDPSVPLPLVLASRFEFPFDTASSCGFVTRQEDGADYVVATNFRPLDTSEDPARDRLNQALAQKVETTVRMNVNNGEDLVLRLSPLPGRTGGTDTFKLPTNAEIVIKLFNDREDHMAFMNHPDKICGDDVGRDFAFFYELALNKPADWKQRPIPHVKYTGMKSIADVFPLPDLNLCLKYKAPLSRPICPMASFDGQ